MAEVIMMIKLANAHEQQTLLEGLNLLYHKETYVKEMRDTAKSLHETIGSLKFNGETK